MWTTEKECREAKKKEDVQALKDLRAMLEGATIHPYATLLERRYSGKGFYPLYKGDIRSEITAEMMQICLVSDLPWHTLSGLKGAMIEFNKAVVWLTVQKGYDSVIRGESDWTTEVALTARRDSAAACAKKHLRAAIDCVDECLAINKCAAMDRAYRRTKNENCK